MPLQYTNGKATFYTEVPLKKKKFSEKDKFYLKEVRSCM